MPLRARSGGWSAATACLKRGQGVEPAASASTPVSRRPCWDPSRVSHGCRWYPAAPTPSHFFAGSDSICTCRGAGLSTGRSPMGEGSTGCLLRLSHKGRLVMDERARRTTRSGRRSACSIRRSEASRCVRSEAHRARGGAKGAPEGSAGAPAKGLTRVTALGSPSRTGVSAGRFLRDHKANETMKVSECVWSRPA
jgi:hypothetical protein